MPQLLPDEEYLGSAPSFSLKISLSMVAHVPQDEVFRRSSV